MLNLRQPVFTELRRLLVGRRSGNGRTAALAHGSSFSWLRQRVGDRAGRVIV